jgi:hypothetical protein
MSSVPLLWRIVVPCLVATALTASRAAAETAPAEVPSPFEPGDEATPTAEATPAAVTPQVGETSPFPAATPAPAPAPAQSPPQPVVVQSPMPVPAAIAARPSRGIGALAVGIALLGVSAVPFGIGGGLWPHWDGCAWDGDTYECGHTGAYLASMLLFGFASAIALGGIILIPIGAVRLARSRRSEPGGAWLGSISPFASPWSDGGAVFGVAGRLP